MKIRKVIVKVYNSEITSVNGTTAKTKEAVYTFFYPEARIEFMISQTDTEQPDNCSVKIFGVSKETFSLFDNVRGKKYNDVQRVEIYYGYDGELSLVFSGVVSRAIYQFANGSQIMTILLSKNNRQFTNMIKAISMKSKQTMKTAINTIAKEYGYSVTYGNDGDFESLSIGRFCYTGSVRSALKHVLPKGYSYYINESAIHVYHVDKSVANEMKIWNESGLLEYPTEDSKQEKTTIKTILIPMVESGMKIKIPIDDVWFSDTDTGKYKTYVVKNYVSSFANGIGTTEFECEGGLNL
ncbi:MAG: hypothetical protein ACRC6E_03345 [Fusobacteriaceae bacterium]